MGLKKISVNFAISNFGSKYWNCIVFFSWRFLWQLKRRSLSSYWVSLWLEKAQVSSRHRIRALAAYQSHNTALFAANVGDKNPITLTNPMLNCNTYLLFSKKGSNDGGKHPYICPQKRLKPSSTKILLTFRRLEKIIST